MSEHVSASGGEWKERQIILHHGERFGSLTVIKKAENGRYKCGCICGYSDVKVRAKALMSGRVKSCRRCAETRDD